MVNQIIHSCVFVLMFNDKNLFEGILFNSDKSKGKTLYMMKVQDFIDVIIPVAQCYINEIRMARNDEDELELVTLR